MSPQERTERLRVVEEARSWIGTPYHSNARVKGAGIDCATILLEVYARAGVIENLPTPQYSEQFFLHQAEELYLGHVLKHAREIAEAEAQFGDVVLYKFGKCYAHSAIIIDPGWPHIVHAYYQARMVVRARGFDGPLGRPKHARKFFTRW
jgi:cell wall-associated NlpC family hydrolase